MRANPPLPPLEHNFIQQQVNQSDYGNEEVADYYQQEEYHHEQPYHGLWNDSSLPAEYDDYGHDDVLSAAMTLPLNSTGGEEKSSAINETTEDLANLSPEALRLNPKYVAYVPIPIKDDDIDEIAIDDDFNDDDDGIDRDDDELFDEDDHYDDDVTPRSSSVRRRPSANVDKVLLPILMVPAGERTKTRQSSDSWRSIDFSDSPSSPPRRFDEEIDGHFEEEEHLTPSSSRRIPGPSRRRNNNGGQRRMVPGIDFRMFGSLAHRFEQSSNKGESIRRPANSVTPFVFLLLFFFLFFSRAYLQTFGYAPTSAPQRSYSADNKKSALGSRCYAGTTLLNRAQRKQAAAAEKRGNQVNGGKVCTVYASGFGEGRAFGLCLEHIQL